LIALVSARGGFAFGQNALIIYIELRALFRSLLSFTVFPDRFQQFRAELLCRLACVLANPRRGLPKRLVARIPSAAISSYPAERSSFGPGSAPDCGY